jgi:hypothetical protein
MEMEQMIARLLAEIRITQEEMKPWMDALARKNKGRPRSNGGLSGEEEANPRDGESSGAP